MKRILLSILWSLVFCHLSSQNISDHIFAVVMSGGRNRLTNYERYWNDCAFLYSTLRQTCHIPKRNITLLMADGDDPAADMLCSGGARFASSPTDLDGDGQPDLHLSATGQNLLSTFNQLGSQLGSDDHLFVFVTDHAELSAQGDACLWLWNNEKLEARHLASLFSQLHAGSVNVVIGTCYAGAFVSWLQGEGRVITASCADDELSWSCPDRPYDEFVYHWTCAVAQHDEQGHPVSSDQNGDGIITMDEAYSYARRNDRRPESPVLVSQPLSLSASWSFSGRGMTDGMTVTAVETRQPQAYDLLGRPVGRKGASGMSVEKGRLFFKKR